MDAPSGQQRHGHELPTLTYVCYIIFMSLPSLGLVAAKDKDRYFVATYN